MFAHPFRKRVFMRCARAGNGKGLTYFFYSLLRRALARQGCHGCASVVAELSVSLVLTRVKCAGPVNLNKKLWVHYITRTAGSHLNRATRHWEIPPAS
ncbi:hypothetical protein MRX96_011338 [Rhipicephalus microplus]